MKRLSLTGLLFVLAWASLAASAQAAPPGNDNLGAAQLISADTAVAAGTTVDATAQGSEPVHVAGGPRASVWYRFTAPAAGVGAVEIDACDADFSSVTAAYRGDSFLTLTPVESGACEISFAVVPGQIYSVAVDSSDTSRGQFTLRLESWPSPPNDNFALPDVVTGLSVNVDGDTRGASKESGEPDFAGDKPASVWYQWEARFTGAVHIKACDGAGQGLRVLTAAGTSLGALNEVSNRLCEDWVEVTAGATYRISVSGARRAFNLRLSGFTRPSNDNFAGVIPLGGSAVQITGDNRGASREPDEPLHGSTPGSASVWYSWATTAPGAVEIDVCRNDVDLEVAIYSGVALNSLTPVADPLVSQPGQCHLRVPVLASTPYRIAVQTRGTTELRGTFLFDLRFVGKPGNDDFAAGQVIPGTAETVATGDLRGASREGSEPDHDPTQPVGSGSVWYRWTAPLDGRALVNVCDDVGSDAFGVAVYQDSGAGLTSLQQRGADRCATPFLTDPGVTYHIAVEGRSGDLGTFVLRILAGVPPPNDNFAAARPLSGNQVTTSGDNLLATYENNEPESGVANPAGSVWFTWTAASAGTLSLDLCGSSFNFRPRVRVYTGSALNALTSRGLSLTLCTGTPPKIAVEADTTYQLRLDGNRLNPSQAQRFGEYVLNLAFVDNTQPETEITAPAPRPVYGPDIAAFEFTSSEPNSTFQCALDSVVFEPCTSPKAYPGLAAGGHVFRVRATDPAGNVDQSAATMFFEMDVDAPLTTILGDNVALTPDATPTFRYRSEPGAEFECRLDGGQFAACNQPAAVGRDGDRELTTAPLADGTYTFEVRARDEAGNLGPIAEREFTVDTTPPTATIDSGPTDPADTTPSFRFSSSEPNSTFSCRIDSGPVFPCSDPSSVPGSQAELTSVALADGAHSFAVRASDAAGNPGQFATLAFAIDISASTPPGGDDPPDGTPPGATAPETVLDLKPKARVVTRGVTKKIRFGFSSPTAGATFECAIQRKKTRKASLAPASFGPCKSPRSYKKKPGIYRFSVRAVAGGLPDETPATYTFSILAAAAR